MKVIPNIVVQFIHIQGGLKGQIQEFTESEVTIGRLPALTLTFPPDEPGVSREHAKVVRDGNQFKLITLKDTFGTFVNGKQVKETVLRNGDVIEFGTGGPKVSFNTEVRERNAAELNDIPERQPEPPVVRKVASSWGANQRSMMSEEPAPFISSPSSVAFREDSPQGNQSPVFLNIAATPMRSDTLGRIDVNPQKVSAPLVIQFGATIRSYRELPVVIGKHARSDFVLEHAGIYDQHAQIIFHQNNYWIKDLTGQQLIRVNGRPLDSPAILNQSDEIQCTPQGPWFRFLGDGRLAEIEVEVAIERPVPIAQGTDMGQRSTAPRTTSQEGLFSKIFKGFK